VDGSRRHGRDADHVRHLLRHAAGEPAVRFAGKQPTPELIAEVERQLGLDKPLFGIEIPRVWESRPWDSQYFGFLERL
jgi:ABC-type dipeptide/oligopeptide/nickel transport system permease component